MSSEIKPKDNGPYLVSGDFKLVDWEGSEWQLEEGKTIALCRCGHSENKPFCDGSHKKIEFADESRAGNDP